MAEFPRLSFFTDRLIGDTVHLSPAEFGALMRLIVCAWRTPECALPDDDSMLGRMVGDRRNWHKWKPLVMALWELGEDGLWRLEWLTSEHKFVSTGRAKKAKAGRASALKRKETGSTPVPTDGQQPIPIPIPSSVEPNGSTDASASMDLDALLYRRGRKLLGKNAGAMVTKLKRATGSVGAALEALEVASRKHDPPAYVAGICQAKASRQDRVKAELEEGFKRWRESL